MADSHVDHLLIGGGIASASCAVRLREAGASGSILLVGREPEPPYRRPPCSKGYLAGTIDRPSTYFRAPEWWGEHGVEVRTRTSVLKLDAGAREARLSSKEVVGFGQALVATGANVRRLNVDGSDLEGIHYLRALGNADAIRADAEAAEHSVLIGGSYIGTEVAASLTAMGLRCAIVMQEEVTLERPFGQAVGRFFHEGLRRRGIEIHGGDALERFEGEDGRVRRVVTARGLELPADLVVIGAGAVPDVMLARGAGLELGGRGGVRCSSRLETSAAGVYAAGDMCEYDSVLHDGPMRIEHWDVAKQQGRTVADNMLGADRPHDAVPYFFSDLGDWSSMEYVGPAYEWDEEVVRGSLEEGAFSVWYLREGRLGAALSVGRSEDLDHARRLIAGRNDLGPHTARLAAADSSLADL